MTPLTPSERAEMRARCAAATPGPLSVGKAAEESDTCLVGSGGEFFCRIVSRPGRPAAGDGLLFASAQADLRRTLDKIDRLEQRVAELEEELQRLQPFIVGGEP